MKIRFHHTKEWRLFVNIVLVMLVVSLMLELFIPEIIEQYIASESMEIFDISFTMVLASDLCLWYAEAKDKYNFIRRNWLRIIAVFPFMLTFRAVQVFRLEQTFVAAFSSEIVADLVVAEKLLKFEKGIKFVSKATEVLKGVIEI